LTAAGSGNAECMSSGSRLLVGFTFGVVVVVGGIVSLATGSWWFLILAIGLHVCATLIVLATLAGRLRQQDKPDPVTEAQIAERRGHEDRPHPAR
jgi:membrane protein implicated in regulation of membrane protease activity